MRTWTGRSRFCGSGVLGKRKIFLPTQCTNWLKNVSTSYDHSFGVNITQLYLLSENIL